MIGPHFPTSDPGRTAILVVVGFGGGKLIPFFFIIQLSIISPGAEQSLAKLGGGGTASSTSPTLDHRDPMVQLFLVPKSSQWEMVALLGGYFRFHPGLACLRQGGLPPPLSFCGFKSTL